MIGARGMLRGGGGGGGPITAGVKDDIEAIEGIGGGPMGAELMAGGGPRFRGGRLDDRGGGMAAELTEQIEAVAKDGGPIGAAGFGGKPGRREWYMFAAPDGSAACGGGAAGGGAGPPEDCSSFRAWWWLLPTDPTLPLPLPLLPLLLPALLPLPLGRSLFSRSRSRSRSLCI